MKSPTLALAVATTLAAAPALGASTIQLSASAGVVAASGENSVDEGPALGAEGLWRNGLLRLGVTGDFGGLFSYRVRASLAGGVGLEPSPRVELAALAEPGLVRYSAVGMTLLGDDPGASGMVPSLGLRLGASLRLGHVGGRIGYLVGLWAFVRADLEQRLVRYSYPTTDSAGRAQQIETAHDIGGAFEGGVLLRMGIELGL